jgi:hypothetical protein
MKLPEYKTLDEKQPFFDMISGTARIHYEPDKFFTILEKMYDENKINFEKPLYVFRGLPEAKFKLLNSVQRYFYEKGLEKLDKPSYEGKDPINKLFYYLSVVNIIVGESLSWQGGVISKLLN